MITIQTDPPLEDVCKIWNEVWTSRPTDVTELRHDAEDLEPHLRPTHWIANLNGMQAGIATRSRDIGSFHPEKWTFELAVLPASTNQGVGTKLYETFLSETIPRGMIQVTSWVLETDERALRFATKRGFEEIKRDFLSCLNLNEFAQPEPVLADGYRVATFASISDSNLLEDLHRLFEEVRVDVPRPDPPTPLSFEFYRDHVIGDPAFRPDLSVAAFSDSKIVGFSTAYDATEPHIAYQGLTGVHRAHRGKGVAQALKHALIGHAKSVGKTELHTDNDTRNAPMLAINESFGFRRSAATITMAKTF